MKYLKKNLYIENVNINKLSNKYITPFYCYSLNSIRENINNLKNKFKKINPLICFAVKSNSNVNLLKEIKKMGCGADVVSMGEMMKALKAGISPNKIVFSGVGKTIEELKFSVSKKVFLINVESESEIEEIEKIAKNKSKIVNIGLRLNPNTNAKTIKEISTGKESNKFGIAEKSIYHLVKFVNKSKYLSLKCLSVHIGSQILDIRPFLKTLKVLERVIKKSNYKFEFLDLGGGFGIPYKKNSKTFSYRVYSESIKKFLNKHNCKIIFEPGRSIIGNSGILVSKIVYIKKGNKKDFIILDAGMNDFMRPALYKVSHRILPIKKNLRSSTQTYEFVGPICETTDSFLKTKKFQKLNEKDYIAICDVGAYGMSLASNYNVRPKPAEILIFGSKSKVIGSRQKIKDLI